MALTQIAPPSEVRFKLGNHCFGRLSADNGAFKLSLQDAWSDEFGFVSKEEFVGSEGDAQVAPWPDINVREGIDIGPGQTVVMGTAGTGKSTTLRYLQAELAERADVVRLDCFEPVPGALGPDAMFKAIAEQLQQREDWTKPMIFVVDSLRFLSVLSSGYPMRLASGAMDLTMLATLTQLDILAKRLNIAIIGSLFFNLYQVTKGDSMNETVVATGLRTFAVDVDGSCQMTILMGPTRRETGKYECWSRSRRRSSVTGAFPAPDAPVEDRATRELPTPEAVVVQARLTPFQVATAPTRSGGAEDKYRLEQRRRQIAQDVHVGLGSADEHADRADKLNLESNFARGIPQALRSSIIADDNN